MKFIDPNIVKYAIGDYKVPTDFDHKYCSTWTNERYGLIAAQYKPKPVTAHCIKNVIFNPPATIVFWADNTKTVVKCGEHDEYDPEKGLAMAFAKKVLGNHGNYYNVFRKWLPKEDEKSSMFDLNKPGIFKFTFDPANIRIHDALGRIFDLGAPTDIKMESESDE